MMMRVSGAHVENTHLLVYLTPSTGRQAGTNVNLPCASDLIDSQYRALVWVFRDNPLKFAAFYKGTLARCWVANPKAY